jgi:hypothetical protein
MGKLPANTAIERTLARMVYIMPPHSETIIDKRRQHDEKLERHRRTAP